jgi:tetratricopeptide (TPR) repeat protein
MTDVWLQLADMYNRRGSTMQAVDAYKEVVKRNPKDAAGLTGAAAGLLRLRKLDEARAHAELAVDTAPAAAHELLARIAVESRDEASARRHAQLAREADPTLPLPPFIEGVLLHAQQQYAAAAAQLLEARNALDTRTVQLPDVNYYLADSLARLERYPEAERYFRAEISLFPAHVRARAGLAMLFRAMGRDRESEQMIAELIRTVPTQEGYEVAAQLWTMFGEPQKAAELRALARRSQ